MSETSRSGKAFFVADLHLDKTRPETTERFFHFLKHIVPGADALYVLGDLFEYWVGDDDLDNTLAHEVANRLRGLAESGTPVFFMHGNRDFLVGWEFAGESGMSLLADPFVVDLFGTPTVLTHGDILCTDDKGYQRFRRISRRPILQKLLLRLPVRLRHFLAGAARSGSERAKAGKAYEVMDVNAEAVDAMLHRDGVTRMIHGHTHRPARHQLMLGQKEAERWVLPDWYAEGGYLVCSSEGCELRTI